MLADPEETVKSRCRYVVMSQKLRHPLAGAAIVLSVVGVVENHAGVDFLLRASVQGASTHPTTGLSIVLLAAVLMTLNPLKRRTRWQTGILGGALVYLLAKLWTQNLMHADGDSPFGASSWGAMGADTGLTLALLYAAALFQRSLPRLGMICAAAAATFIGVAFLAFSYGHTLFEGQMAVATLIALFPLALSVLTLFARRPVLRVMMLAGPVGDRTRNTIAAGFIVPWLGGLILYRWLGVPDRALPAEALIVGTIIMSIALVAIGSGLYHERVDWSRRQLSRQLVEIASIDHLTKALNRTGISFEIENRWQSFLKRDIAQCVLLIDLDHFKKINDLHGHDEGDRVLATISKVVRPCLRSGDAIGRWGGEEFVVMLEGVDKIKAVALANRLRNAISDISMDCASSDGCEQHVSASVTASVGVAFFQKDDLRPSDAIKRADIALYEAKSNGRNRVEALVPVQKTAA